MGGTKVCQCMNTTFFWHYVDVACFHVIWLLLFHICATASGRQAGFFLRFDLESDFPRARQRQNMPCVNSVGGVENVFCCTMKSRIVFLNVPY
jgi:hypothetical protein